jgi:serine/threonine protein kinase
MQTRWGKRFGRYEIIAELGRGAMGVVYKARDPKIDRFVAVKAISLSTQNPEEEREYRERFFHEAQAAGRLLHPGIVTIFDTGEDPEGHIAYIVMEYIAGQSLDRMLSEKSKKLPLEKALLLTEELAEALDHAHGQGVIHRDMKPANILVTPDGHAKIADFGIAKMNQAYMTLRGQVLGTPAYMSPEQLEGERVDQRSDLFSLGAILYRMVTGYSAFQGNSTATVCFKVANRDPLRASAVDPELPPELDAVITRAMAKEPSQRYQRGLEFALDLHELRERGQALNRTPDRPAWFPGSRVSANRPSPQVVNSPTAANYASAALFKTLSQAAKKVPPFIQRQVLPHWRLPHWRLPHWRLPQWNLPQWRLPAVRVALIISIATLALSLFAYHHHRQVSLNKAPAVLPSPVVAPPMALAAAAEAANAPPIVQPAPLPAGLSTEPTALPTAKKRTVSLAAKKSHSKTAIKSAGESAKPSAESVATISEAPEEVADPPRPVAEAPKPVSYSAKPVVDSTLDIQIEHRFSEADLSIWVDDKLAFDQPLRGQIKKHWNPFRANVKETESVRIASGKHRVRIRVRSTPEKYEQTETIVGSFAKNHPATLLIDFQGHAKDMQLEFQKPGADNSPVSEPAPE